MSNNATLAAIKKDLEGLQDPGSAIFLQRFFKTGPGEYGHGDLFRGIRVPVLRRLAKKYQGVSIVPIRRLLCSTYHEDRLLALLLLTDTFSRGDDAIKELVFDMYLKNTRFINNWDLVDASAPPIVGAFLWEKDRSVLFELATSKDLWKRRISVIATFYFIKRGDFNETLKIATILLSDEEDLIHKAVGWMLREVGNRNRAAEEKFLKRYYQLMPRVMLRYAIEKFPERERRRYLKGLV